MDAGFTKADPGALAAFLFNLRRVQSEKDPAGEAQQALLASGARLFGNNGAVGSSNGTEKERHVRPSVKSVSLSRPVLTVIVVIDPEKPVELTRAFFSAIREWNRKGVKYVQIIAVTQKRQDSDLLKIASAQPFPVNVIHAVQDWVGGYPIWDVPSSVRYVWGLVQGEYVTFAHPEFLYAPLRLKRVCDYLLANRPMIAFGNLRWPGDKSAQFDSETGREASKPWSEKLLRMMADKEWYSAAAHVETCKTAPWMPGQEITEGPCEWQEDVLFIRRDWLGAMRFFWHITEMPFQDIYDLLGIACHILGKYGLAPLCERMPITTSLVLHLWHSRQWASWTQDTRAWFMQSPGRWHETAFLRSELWEKLCGKDDAERVHAVAAIRHGHGGTTARFGQSLERWLLREDGLNVVLTYYETIYGRGYTRAKLAARFPQELPDGA